MIEYYRRKLSHNGQEAYQKMLTAFKGYRNQVDIQNCDESEIVNVYMAVYYDHPELFYLSHAPQMAKRISFFGSSLTLISNSIFTSSEISFFEKRINEIKTDLRSLAGSLSDESDKEKVVVDYLLDRVAYEINNTYNQNAATVLVKNKGQCSGISKAVKLLLDYLGIECIVIDGTGRDDSTGTSGPHAWNIVKINGKYYHLDVTFMIGANVSKRKPFRYLYFNGTDVEFQKNHTWQKNKYPVCDTTWLTRPERSYSVSTIKKEETTIVPSCKVITSMFFFRYEIGKLLDERGRALTFISKTKAKGASDISTLYLKEAVKVANSKGIAVSINVSVKGDEVTINLIWK